MIKQLILRTIFLDRQNKKDFSSLRQQWLRAVSPILIGILLLLGLWWLMPSIPAYAADPIFTDSGQELGNLSTVSVALGDLNGDGHLDAFVANATTTDEELVELPNKVWFNDGRGNFSDSGQELGRSRNAAVALGDLDGDGDLDAVIANGQILNQVLVGVPNQVWLNDGSGHFVASESFGDSVSTAITLGDLDGDGDLDAFVGNLELCFATLCQGDKNKVWLNDGSGHFTDSNQDLGGSITAGIALADLDADGDLDAFVGNGEACLDSFGCLGTPANKIWLNDGNGHFIDSGQQLGDSTTIRIELGDLDGDGDLDAFVANGQYTFDGFVEQPNKVWLNNGAGQFTETQSLGNLVTSAISLADFDGDGDLDAFVRNINVSRNQANELWLNNGDAHFTQHSKSFGNSSENSSDLALAVGDLDGDGDIDAFAGNVGANEVWLNGNHSLNESQSLSNSLAAQSVAVGDVDGDHDLDALVGSDGENQIWLNNGNGVFIDSGEHVDNVYANVGFALADLDGDNDLDAFLANCCTHPDMVWLNDGSGHFEHYQTFGNSDSQAVGLGDLDRDGDLDAFVPNKDGEANLVWLNDSTGNFSDSGQNLGKADSRAVALGDVDDDGDLDAFVGNDGANQLWLNDGNAIFHDSQRMGSSRSMGVALGDLDSDGDLDAFVTNHTEVHKVWLNDGAGHFTDSGQSVASSDGVDIALGDLDGDGDLDALIGNGSDTPNTIWFNDGEGTFTKQERLSNTITRAVALGDFNRDGNLDLFAANKEQDHKVYLGTAGGTTRFQVTLQKPGPTLDANFYSTPVILDDPLIPITYSLFDPNSTPIGRVELFYSMDGGANWQPAEPTADTITSNLGTNPHPTTNANNTHQFIWDTFASGFFGQSDNVVLRLVAYSQPPATGTAGTYLYTNKTPGPYQWPYASATTFPFAVRGTQVRIYTDTIATGNELANALVYRLPAGQTIGANPIASSANDPFVSDLNGYLRGRGELALGDQLMALLPISSTDRYTLYHTSAPPSEMGLDMFEVTAPGTQELVVSSDNSLIVFDLHVSLEWDARNDDIFLNQLESDLQRTSQILYDLTNGQVALGKIRVYHAKQNWLDSHILIYASNNLRPSADLGGIVQAPVHDILSNGQVITDAYLPGQLRMSAIWNRFGNPTGEVGEDWPRTLAHELGHYLLFLPDNYLGLSEDGLLTLTECQGSAMSDPYREDYSEFLTSQEWTGDCLNTLAQYTTGRTDWETIKKFYQMFDASGGNPGPHNLPLAVTEVTFIDPGTPVQTLNDPFFHVTDENSNPLGLPFGQAQGYLFKTKGTTDPTDDSLMPVGSPIQDQLRVRGAELGDRLCLFDYSQTPRRLGCVEEISQSSTNLSLHQVPGWQPQIKVASVTSYTLAVTVTQAIASDTALHVQVLPAAEPTTMEPNLSPIATLNRVTGTDTFTQTITLAHPIANGFIRIWAEGTPLREEITEFFFSGGWGPSTEKPTWGPSSHRYGWGASRKNSWQAPISARDGQVTIFDLDNILGGNSTYALQLLSTPPNLPSWLAQVGQAYHFSAAEALPDTLNIKFEYLERELPLSREDRLRIYYSPDEGQSWQRLETRLDTDHNHASAQMPGEGIYTVISTVELEPFDAGWNTFTYSVPQTRTITTALTAIEGKYTSVYYDFPNSSEWWLYDQTVADKHPDLSAFVNDLTHFEDGNSYWIHTTEPITLSMAPGSNTRRQRTTRGLEFPPATYYGWITANDSFQPTVGMPIKARIGDIVCGESTIEEINGQLAYKIQVRREDILQPDGCGIGGRNIVFEVGDWVMEAQRNWDNSQAQYHPLSEGPPDSGKEKLYLPLIINSQ